MALKTNEQLEKELSTAQFAADYWKKDYYALMEKYRAKCIMLGRLQERLSSYESCAEKSRTLYVTIGGKAV